MQTKTEKYKRSSTGRSGFSTQIMVGLWSILIFGSDIQAGEDTSPFSVTLRNPTSYKLQIPDNLLQGVLKEFPEVSTCHSQGIDVLGDQFYLTCMLYNTTKKEVKSFVGEAIVLKAPFQDILAAKAKIDWKFATFTEPLLSTTEHARVKASIDKYEKANLPKDKPFHFQIAHPSGIAADPELGGIWTANAVYSRNTYGYITLMDPTTLAPKRGAFRIDLPNHLAFVTKISDRILLTATSSCRQFVFIDTKTGKSAYIENTISEGVDYQECTRWDDEYLLCNGNEKSTKDMQVDGQTIEEVKHRYGRVHVLRYKGKTLEEMDLMYEGNLEIQMPGKTANHDFGTRIYKYIPGKGDVFYNEPNQYGKYSSQLTLTNNGMMLSKDKKYMYFLPEDVPGGELIRLDVQAK